MNTILPLIFVSTFIAGCYGQFDSYYCKYLDGIDCSGRTPKKQCGTDGVTYANDCALSQVHCKDNSVHQAYLGECRTQSSQMVTGVMTTTPFPINGSEIAFDIFCLDLFHHNCNNEPLIEVCASDNNTYDNLCEYEKQKCTHRQLALVKQGRC